MTEEEYVNAAILGWCVELVSCCTFTASITRSMQPLQLQAYFLVADDIMDASITRRSQPCWYLSPSPTATTPSQGSSITSSTHKHPPVGMIAINDSFMIGSAIYYLLKVHFRKHACYVDLVELFHDITFKTEMGQLVDLITAPEGVVDLARFSLER